jgi:competence transcription factor ComK
MESIRKHPTCGLIATETIYLEADHIIDNHETKKGLSSQGKCTLRVSEFSLKNLLKISIYWDLAFQRKSSHFPGLKKPLMQASRNAGKV